MIKEIEFYLKPEESNNKESIQQQVNKNSGVDVSRVKGFSIVKRSIDARRKEPLFRFAVNVFIDAPPEKSNNQIKYREVNSSKKVIIVGSGPAGLFAALRLIEAGIKPVIFERGKDVRERRRDLRAIQQFNEVNPDSNYCFGEGGAGTYSDGKLYTRSNKRGDIKKVLNILVQHGAVEDILIDAHPHIGSNKLPKIVANIRETILNCGGEFHFNSRVTGLIIENKKIRGVVINNSEEKFGDAVILATGHSARDIYYLLDQNNISIERKPFAIGVRIEHPQSLIDSIMYHSVVRSEHLPAASYNLACQIDGRGVYSFCMCPGGIIVPAASAPGELVLNGMSVSRRDSPFANSGFVVTVEEEDINEFKGSGVFAGLEFQKSVEIAAYKAGNFTQQAPSQRAVDFVAGRLSTTIPKTSYIPGTVNTNLWEVLPLSINQRLKAALIEFNKKMRGYLSEDAVMLATESRTSSPIRIPRSRETFMHSGLEMLYPAGEGAGYAGGIVSAAIDGENVANAISLQLVTER